MELFIFLDAYLPHFHSHLNWSILFNLIVQILLNIVRYWWILSDIAQYSLIRLDIMGY